MKNARNILNLILVLAIVAAVVPIYHPTDKNRDNKIDLKDALLHVQGTVNAEKKPAALEDSLKKAITSLLVTAGLENVIKPNKSTVGKDVYGSSHNFYIIEAAYIPFLIEETPMAKVTISTLKSITLPTIKPPPRRIFSS